MPTTIFNPFKNRDPREVWEEIRRTKKPINYQGGISKSDAEGFFQTLSKVASMQPKIKLTNPFAGAKDRNQVWKELMEKSKPIDRKEFMEIVKSKQKEK